MLEQKKSEVKVVIVIPNQRFLHASSFTKVGDNVLHVAGVRKLPRLSSGFYMSGNSEYTILHTTIPCSIQSQAMVHTCPLLLLSKEDEERPSRPFS
jgi:hypothetical protein